MIVRAREGVILVAAVLVLLALGLVALGLLFVSTQEALIARSTHDAVRVRTAAESAVRAAVAGWWTGDYRELEVGGRRPAVAGYARDGLRVETTVERLRGHLYLVRAEAEQEAGSGATASAAMLVRALGIGELWEGFPAAIASRGPADIAASAVVEGTTGIARDVHGGAGGPVEVGENCPPEALDTMHQVFGPGDRPGVLQAPPTVDSVGPLVGGDDPPGGALPQVDSARLGPLGWSDLRRLADHGLADGSIVLTYVRGGHRLTGGIAQGVLIVEGDLELAGDAAFRGAVRVGGRLVVRDDARIQGAVAAVGREGVRVMDRARVVYDACALWSAFTEAPGLNRALATPERRWVAVP